MSEASLARQITLGKPGAPESGALSSEEKHDLAALLHTADSKESASGSSMAGELHTGAGQLHTGSAEGTEMLSMSSRRRLGDETAPVASSPPREAWPSILLQPQDHGLLKQSSSQASLQLPNSSAPESPFFHPQEPIPEEKPLIHAPFGSSVIHRPSEDLRAFLTAPQVSPPPCYLTCTSTPQHLEVIRCTMQSGMRSATLDRKVMLDAMLGSRPSADCLLRRSTKKHLRQRQISTQHSKEQRSMTGRGPAGV